MAYDKNVIVPIPKGTIPVKIGNKTYIYYVVEKVYRKDKKNNSDVRVPVGLKVDDTNEMYINNNFIKYFNDEYLAKIGDEKLSAKLNFSDGINYGATSVMHKLADRTGLLNLLRENFDDEFIYSNSIINLATKFVITNNSSVIGYPHFARNNLILGEKLESDTDIENMLGSITEADIDSFLEDWIKHTCNGRDLVLSIDGSNVQTEVSDIEIAELGHSKSGLIEKQISFSLVTDQERYMPVYYKEYDGTTHDLQAAKKIMNMLKLGNPKTINFVLDRGYFSRELMMAILKDGNGFIMMAKENKQIRNVIDIVIDEVYDVNNYIPSLDLYALRTVGRPFERMKNPIFYHIYFSPDIRNENIKTMHTTASNMKNEASKLIGEKLDENDILKYNKLLNLTFENNILIQVEINKDKINELLKYSGYFVIITSYISSSEQAYNVYHNRDYTEKLIMVMKTYEQFSCVRCHDTKHLKSKNLCMFVGLILRNEIFVRTKKLRENTKDKKAYTTPEILRELDCIQATRDSDGRYSKKTAYTKKEKAILEALDMQVGTIEGALKVFNKTFSIKR